MANLAEMIEEEAGEAIEAVVIGDHYADAYKDDDEPRFNNAPSGKVLTWADAKPFLDYKYDNGYGGADCHPVIAWSRSKVIFICEYDGSTQARSIPRYPVTHAPDFF